MHDKPVNYSSITIVRFPKGNSEMEMEPEEWFHYYNYDPDDDTIGGAMRRWVVKGEPTEILAHYIASIRPGQGILDAIDVHRFAQALDRANEWMEAQGK